MKKALFGLLSYAVTALALAAVNINTATVEELKALPGYVRQRLRPLWITARKTAISNRWRI